MIERDSNMQVLRCDICGDIKPFSRGTAANPEAMFIAAEEMTSEHAECQRWVHNPRRARIERQVQKRIRREFQQLQCGRSMFSRS